METDIENKENVDFSKLWSEHTDSLFYFILASTNCRHDAEEIMQDVAVTALIRFDNFKSKKSKSFLSWILKIAKYHAIDYYRNIARIRNLDKKLLDVQHMEYFEDAVIVKMDIEQYIKKMSPGNKHILRLHIYYELGPKEISILVNAKYDAVQKQLRRLMIKLENVFYKGQ